MIHYSNAVPQQHQQVQQHGFYQNQPPLSLNGTMQRTETDSSRERQGFTVKYHDMYLGLGIWHIVISSLIIIGEIINLALTPDAFHLGSGLFVGFILFIIGVCSVLTSVKKSKCCLITTLIFASIAPVVMLIGISMTSIEISHYNEIEMYNFWMLNWNWMYDQGRYNYAKTQAVGVLLVCLAEFVICIVNAVFCCSECCCPSSTTPQRPTGGMVVTGVHQQPVFMMTFQPNGPQMNYPTAPVYPVYGTPIPDSQMPPSYSQVHQQQPPPVSFPEDNQLYNSSLPRPSLK